MRLEVEHKPLLKALNVAASAVARSHAPILEAIHIGAGGNSVSFTGANSQMEITASCEASTPSEGVACVNCADLKAFLSRSSGVVSIELEGDNLKVSTSAASAAFPTWDTAKFPRITPDAEREVSNGIAALEFCKDFCAPPDAPKAALSGVYLGAKFAAATDGQRFIICPSEGAVGQVIPKQSADHIVRHAMRLFVGDNTWRAEAVGVRMTGKLIADAYPDVSRIQFDEPEFMTCDADELIAAVEQATFGRSSDVFLSSDGRKAILSGERWQGQHVATDVTMAVEGQPVSFVMRSKQILQAASALSGHQIEFSTDGRAMKIKPVNGGSYAMLTTVADSRTNYGTQQAAA